MSVEFTRHARDYNNKYYSHSKIAGLAIMVRGACNCVHINGKDIGEHAVPGAVRRE